MWGLQVTDATDRVLQLRALMSAPDSGRAWNSAAMFESGWSATFRNAIRAVCQSPEATFGKRN